MVDTSLNGAPLPELRAGLPELIHLTADDARRVPAPGTQRDLRAQTGRSFDELVGETADGADRIQTMIWMKLRRDYPGLRWDDCADVDVIIDPGALPDPTRLVDFATSPPSAGSGA